MIDREQFRLDRVARMQEVSDRLFGPIDQALTDGLEGEEFADEVRSAIEGVFIEEYKGVGEFDLFNTPAAAFRWAWERIRPGLDAAKATASARRIADWLGTAVVNAARMASGDEQRSKMWLSRRDDRVRPMHVEADGQVVPYNARFTVGGYELDFPGQPVGPPSVWINCRCVVTREAVGEFGVRMAESFGQHDVIFLENRRTPKVVSKGARYQPKPSEGRITKRRAATADEEKVIARGDWVRVNERGEKPGDPGYMRKKSKVRPQNNAGQADAFAADPEATGKVIVAIPAADDPIWDASSEPVPHMTMIWLGKQEFTDEPWQAILAGVRSAAEQFGELEGPQEVAVTSREPLGDDDADVLMVDPGKMANLRDYMLTHETIRAAFDAVEQYPQWTPHVTLGYPETPAKGEPGETIRFDRLAVWDGDYEGEEFPMSVAVEEDAPVVEDVEPVISDDEDFVNDVAVPWYGVLAPEGEWSGDKRRFSEGALEWRDLPIPLLWQEKSGMGHEGSVVVGQIADIWKDNGLVWGAGTFAATEDADKVIGLVAEEHLRGVSIDVDAAEMALEDDEQSITFSKGRISAATVVPIPAFSQAFIRLGLTERPMEGESVAASGGPGTVGAEDVPLPGMVFREYDAEARKRMAEDGRALPDGSYPIADEEDLRNAIHAIGRAKDPEAARAHIKKRARALGKGDLIPEEWADDALAAALVFDAQEAPLEALAALTGEFKRGPGWVTDPVATKRIHDYWTKPGHEGYAKIAWGTPGDFRRLRAHLAKYIGPRFLNRTVAQWHHDALGYWPGEKGKPGNPPLAGQTVEAALHLVAAGGWCAPSEWFSDPSLNGPTPLTVTEEGRIFGHLATWGTCHIGIPGACTTPPHSASGYAYYMTGAIRTDDGQTLAVGQITMDTGHAPLRDGARAAAAHYDHTGAVVADVRAGEDEFGIWVAGAVRPDASEQQRHALRAGALSGDWRAVGGNLELVAALAVNVPGFPIPRVGIAASGDMQSALVAAGITLADRGSEADVDGAVADLVMAVADEVENRAKRRKRAQCVLDETRALRVAALTKMVEV